MPADLHDLCADRTRSLDVGFTRQAVAAFLDYFFDRPDGPDPVWVEAAGEIDRGRLEVADVPAFVARSKRKK